MHNIRHCPTTAYRPQANSIVERVNRVIKERLRALMAVDDDWDEKLPVVTTAYNRSIHSSTGMSPFYAFYFREPYTPTERMLKRVTDDGYPGCSEFVEKMLPEAVKVYDEIKKANDAAWERNEAYFAKKYRAWLVKAGQVLDRSTLALKYG